MKRNIIQFLSIPLFLLCFLGTAIAGEIATQEECVAKCKAAADMVKEKGLEATLAVINDKNGPFVWKDTYVFCIDIDRQANIAHPITPKLIGKNLMGAKDANGKLFFAEFINVASTAGSGWVEYMWPKPGEKSPSPKSTYVYKVSDHNVFMAAGIYK
ncbi:MAG: cache domain-containing protein [Pseudomonadota bacterium]